MARADYMSWKSILRTPPSNDGLQTAERLWSDALELLTNGERDWRQRLPRDLVDEELPGFNHVRNILDTRPNVGGDARFIRVARLFLMVITHSALLDCLSVDTYVGDLYNFISGSGGTRAIPFFQSLNNSILSETGLASRATDPESIEDLLIAMTTALRELLRRVPKAILHDDLPLVVQSLNNISEVLGLDESSVAAHTLVKRVAELQRMIWRAQGIRSEDANPVEEHTSPVVVSTYPRDIQLPGNRHDNDKMDITEINIIPTEDEIRSEHPDFLPSPNTDQPHFLEGVERLFDTHFRLLRHDIFGELKSVLGGLLKDRENLVGLARSSSLLSNNTNAHAYPYAYVRYLSFTKKSGLEVQISFPQPRHMQKKSATERRRWWEDTKRLEEGSLLCLLPCESENTSLLFFTVSKKATDPKDEYSLISDGHYGTITAKLPSGSDEKQVKSLISLSLDGYSQGILVEFPGVLLATFVPTLQNIQQMQNVSRLPFENWIIPNPVTGHAARDPGFHVPPPLYARKEGFTYNLRPILKPTADVLELNPRSNNDELLNRLEQSIPLDRGQREALIAALTREFALIQGPPGTGKSYLGIQLMRVLIANSKQANLGPIVVV